MKIVLLQRVLPAYREPLFETLRMQAQLAGHGFDLWVSAPAAEFSQRGTVGGLPWARLLAVKTLPNWLGGFEYQCVPWRDALAADVLVVPDSARCVSNMLLLLARRLLGKRVLTWGHGANFQPGGLSRLLARCRIAMLHLAHGHLVYTQTCVAALQAKGFAPTQIALTENAIDSTPAAGLHAQHPEVLAFRAAHGLGDAPCVVFLGSWYARKRPQVIVELGMALRQQIPGARVLVIGGGSGLAEIAALAVNLPWITLLGPLHGRNKFVALSAARCLVVSGVAGLNLLDAMAVGLPVVLPQRADHSPEVAYVVDNFNGMVVADSNSSLTQACSQLLTNDALHAHLCDGARQTSASRTIDAMAGNILKHAGNQIHSGPVVFVYQRMLPYHQARFAAVSAALHRQGRACVAVEVASFDRGYGQLSDTLTAQVNAPGAVQTLFAGADYLDLAPKQVAKAVFDALCRLSPTTVFAPAPAFAEGAGALHYKVRRGGRLVLMDDAWAKTDHRGRFTHWVKQVLYGYMDGGFFPSPLHGDYFAKLNIPNDRQRYAVDVVGGRPVVLDLSESALMANAEPYLLFVGRLIHRKGLDVLLRAMVGLTAPVHLVVIGDGPDRAALQALAVELGIDCHVQWLGRCTNTVTRCWMTQAQALLIPSEFEQWGLAANEAWMTPTLVLGSDTVGALKATYSNSMQWMLVPVGDVAAWQAALSRVLLLTPAEKAVLLEETRQLAVKYSMTTHTQSVMALANLLPRQRPWAPAGWLAQAWQGRVAVW